MFTTFIDQTSHAIELTLFLCQNTDICQKRFGMTLHWSGLELKEAKHGLIIKLSFKASVCDQIEIFPRMKVLYI